MKWAIFSDVHANLPALEAVWHDIQSHAPDAVFCLGDVVNQHVWNREVIAFMREHHILTLQGNHDLGIGQGLADFPFSFSSPDVLKWGREAIAFTLSQLGEAERHFLLQLPRSVLIDFEKPDGRPFRVMLTHGSPSSVYQYLYENLPEPELLQALHDAQADLLLVGHTHRPYYRWFQEDGQRLYLINAGSAGRPKDGDWRPAYVMIDWHLETDQQPFQVYFHRVEYDLDKSIKAIQRSPLSLYFASCLMKGA